MKRQRILIIAGILYLLLLTDLEGMIRERSQISVLKEDTVESTAFREQKLSRETYEKLKAAAGENGDWIELLTSSMLDGGFEPTKITASGNLYRKYKANSYEELKNAYRAVWEDVVYFPVASSDTAFENTWLAAREYGGKRFHEGCDLFGKVKDPGYYPIVSMTDGIVEQKGWLPLGGSRIGIRSPHGGYFYYAHLASYERDIQIGDTVKAGDILGYMGNTGYGEEETAGKFPTHLHLGIYIQPGLGKELSVNPYWVLRIFEKKIRNYTY